MIMSSEGHEPKYGRGEPSTTSSFRGTKLSKILGANTRLLAAAEAHQGRRAEQVILHDCYLGQSSAQYPVEKVESQELREPKTLQEPQAVTEIVPQCTANEVLTKLLAET